MIRIDWHIRVGEKYFQANTPRSHVVQRLDIRVARRETLAIELSIDPLKEELDQRFTMCQPMHLLGFPDELAIAYFVFDGVQRLDLLQRLGGAGRFRRQSIEEASAGMSPTSGVVDPSFLGVLFVRGVAVSQ